MDFVPTHEVLGAITVDTVGIDGAATGSAEILELIEDGRFGLSCSPVVLRRVVESAFNSIKGEFPDSDLVWKLVIDDLGSQLFADKKCLEISFGELIRNAAQFSKPGGTICVRVVCEFGRNVVTIEDDGIGIPEPELSQLGQKGFCSSRSNMAELSGEGHGFTAAKNLITMHDGEIVVNSDDLGTTVVVQLGATGRW